MTQNQVITMELMVRGGLLILYGSSVVNKGTLFAQGTAGGWVKSEIGAAGGGSGGGSINIFYKTQIQKGTINANGGAGGGTGGNGSRSGGAGGTGSIAIGQIVDGTYVDTYHNWSD